MDAEQKTCSKCGVLKPLTEFHVKKQQVDGLNTQCKACVRGYSRAYHRAKTESAINGSVVHEYVTTDQSKRCPKCGEIKPIRGEFSVNKSKYGGFSSHCKACKNEKNAGYYTKNKQRIDAQHKDYFKRNETKIKAYKRAWSKTPNAQAKNMLNQARHRAKRKSIPFSITLDDIQLPNFCPVLGILLDYGHKGGHLFPNSPSLDRRIPKLGYVKGNVEVISMKANMIKTHATPEEILRVALYFGMMS